MIKDVRDIRYIRDVDDETEIGDVDVKKLIEKLEGLDIPQDAPVHVRDGDGRWIRVSKIEFWGGLILID